MTVKFDVYGRFQVEVVREAERWQVYRLAPGKRILAHDRTKSLPTSMTYSMRLHPQVRAFGAWPSRSIPPNPALQRTGYSLRSWPANERRC